MRNWIAGSMAVLGVLLVLGGTAIVVLKATGTEPRSGDTPTEATAPARASSRLVNAVRTMTPADRLVGWGIVLLVLAAVAAGAIDFNLNAGAGTP